MDYIPDGVMIVNPTLHIVYWNTILEEWTGIPRNKILTKSLTEQFPNLNSPKYLQRLQFIFNGGSPAIFSSQLHGTIIPCKYYDNTDRIQHTTVRAVNIPQEEGLFALFVIQDVTNLSKKINTLAKLRKQAIYEIGEREKVEKALKNREQRYRALFDRTNDAVFILSLDLIHLEVNQKAADMLGYTVDELRGMPASKVVAPREYSDTHRVRNALLAGEIVPVYERVFVKKDGTEFIGEINAALVYDANGEPLHIQSAVRNITARKRADEALRMNETRYRNLFEESPISLWEEDFSAIKRYFDELRQTGIKDFREYFEDHPDSVVKCANMVKILDVNQATLDLYKARDKAELLGNLDKIFSDEAYEAFKEELIVLAEGRTEFKVEASNITLEGEQLDIILELTIAPDHEDTLSRVLVSILDITKRKQMEQELRKASTTVEELNESLKTINSILRHDLLNDLTAIQGFLELYSHFKDEESLEQTHKVVNKSINLIQRMRELEHLVLSDKPLRPYNAQEVVQTILSNYKNSETEFNVRGEGVILADPALSSVIDNLIQNALIHANTKRIDITIEMQEKFCELRIDDFGSGIPDAIKTKIFEPGFKYGKTGHTGYGLYIVKKIIERYNGAVWVEDNKPQGTTFVLKLQKPKT